MNKKSLLFIVLIFVGALAVWLLYALMSDKNNNYQYDGTMSYVQSQDEIMHDMMYDMMSVQETGNADKTYLMGMIPHHNAAIEMANNYLEYDSENVELRNIAQNIINTQQQEVEYMNDIVQSINDTNEENELSYIRDFNEAMNNNHSHNTYDDIDTAFAEGMAEHHQMAIDMSNIILKYGNDDRVKELAQNIIVSQSDEIEQMMQYINN